MGLLDSVLGQVMGNSMQQMGQQTGAGAASGLGSLGDPGQLADALSNLLADQAPGSAGADAAQSAGAMGGLGGLGGLVSRFEQAGMGDVVASWIGSGNNAPVSGDQLHQALGGDVVSGLAQRFGMNAQTLLPLLAALLPQLIDRLTPQGRMPAGGLGSQQNLAAMLAQMLGQR